MANPSNEDRLTTSLGPYLPRVEAALAEMGRQKVISRLWARDFTLWKPDPAEISNRLGWLQIIEPMQEAQPALVSFVEEVRALGYTHALLLGMGGSSLAPEVFRKTFGVRSGYLDLSVLDTTDPRAVLDCARRLDPVKTMFIVSTKSGGTVETLSAFKFFNNQVAQALGADRAGEHFVAITDAGTQLQTIAERYRFRKTFFNDPHIGGRFSALSFFGLAPAALIGLDLETLLDRASRAAVECKSDDLGLPSGNPGAVLGAILGELARAGRDKLTLFLSPHIASFGDWVEQLVAESTCKDCQGILPVVGEPAGPPQVYGDDRLFVHLRLEGDATYDQTIQALQAAGHPCLRLRLKDPYDLGEQFFLWEVATAVSANRLGINPFDQPDVEAAKVLARRMVVAYEKDGRLPELEPDLRADGMAVFSDPKLQPAKPATLEESLSAFLAQAQAGDYIALQAYIQPTEAADVALQDLRVKLRDRARLATTLGYGPRFLHSTGQLHKGDAGNGLFVQITDDATQDAPIPDEAGSSISSMSFGVLKLAQALGDRQALLEANRRVMRYHMHVDAVRGIRELTGFVK